MTKHKIICVAGARPNFVKIAPIMRALRADPRLDTRLVHTGQHYDNKLSGVFFSELGIPEPDISMGVGSGSHARQTADVLARFEEILEQEQPRAVLVVGDVNSTAACAMAASKFRLRGSFGWKLERNRTRPVLIHVEAGLRSYDNDMPEEINRRVTDTLSDLLFVSEPAGIVNLVREGVEARRIHHVGNVMIDSLVHAQQAIMGSPVLSELGLEQRSYGVVTLHRPSNVDDPVQLASMLSVLDGIAAQIPLVFPAHPRTQARLEAQGIALDPSRWLRVPPLGYVDFLRLVGASALVLTDSGGIQEETTVLGVRCLTLRDNTERPITVDEGTNVLAGTTRDSILAEFERCKGQALTGRVPQYWDGRAAERIHAAIVDALEVGDSPERSLSGAYQSLHHN